MFPESARLRSAMVVTWACARNPPAERSRWMTDRSEYPYGVRDRKLGGSRGNIAATAVATASANSFSSMRSHTFPRSAAADDGLVRTLGVLEVLGALGLILPPLTGPCTCGGYRARTDPGRRNFSSPKPGRGEGDRAERPPTHPRRRRSGLRPSGCRALPGDASVIIVELARSPAIDPSVRLLTGTHIGALVCSSTLAPRHDDHDYRASRFRGSDHGCQ